MDEASQRTDKATEVASETTDSATQTSDASDKKGGTAGDVPAGLSGSKPAHEIKGNLPYTPALGSFKNVLDALIAAERPDKFTNNFMETVLGQSGGGARAVPPLLKKMGFLQSDGTPTDLYSKFKTGSGRAAAAMSGLRNAFGEIFKKNEHAHKANEEQLRDLIVEITGLKRNDNIVRLIYGTFTTIRDYIPANFSGSAFTTDLEVDTSEPERYASNKGDSNVLATPGLSYQMALLRKSCGIPLGG
ncbi:DUF5343 domain-containing protein [Rubellimicrobium mesophilum]|uniref:DUF5343 domain-containing protein n=1 Tax=Rubellimicrobium mesophilum TaxID=1123067 RepID=UPI0012E17504|nr:DUF5343 domain-containing protein [Rubellimicrobium mesophilum]